MRWSMTFSHVVQDRIALYAYIRNTLNINLSEAGLVIDEINTRSLHAKMLRNCIYDS
jgi:hypothetical protein